ncbi:MAG: serine/threonine-protein phosphatase [Actinomycetota bacterium]|nr:serine/threonine-protein phosphatase [Actinomycetota bacterium]
MTTSGNDTAAVGANSRGRWTAAATVLVAVVVDLLFDVEASLIVPLVFGPFVASALASVRDTVVVSIVATALGLLLGWADDSVGSSSHVVRVASVALGGCLAVWLAVQRVAREAKLKAVTHVAEVAQAAILHPLPPEMSGVRLAARYISASAEAQIGGDFYDAVSSDWGVRIIVGDVRGKGLGAVRLASALVGEFRSRAMSEPSISAVAKTVDEAGSRMSDASGEDFATALFVQLEGATAAVVRCGHPPPLMAEGREVRTITTSASLPLCLGTQAVCDVVPIPPGARILLYSDGALEGRDASGAYFDLVSSFARHARAAEPTRVLDGILADLDRHCGGGIGDDVVLLLVEVRRPGRKSTGETGSGRRALRG